MFLNWETVVGYLILCVVLNQGSYAFRGPELMVLNVTENEIDIKWSPISNPEIVVQKYQVSAYPLKSYGHLKMINRNEWTFSNTTSRSELMGLHPATLYNVSVWAVTNKGLSEPSIQNAWTEVGMPDEPPPIEIHERTGKTVSVNIPQGSSSHGPITSYRVVMFEKSPIVFFSPEEIGDFSQSQESGLPYYITAELSPEEANETFVVGNQNFYGGYYNAPLSSDKEYEVISGVVSMLNGVTKVAYSALQPTENSHIMAHSHNDRVSSTLSVMLSAAIGVFGFLLVLSVVVYFLLRKRYGRRRPSDELALKVHVSEGEENGFMPGVLHLDDETDLTEFYDLLREHYWQIPKSHLEIHQSVLGIGQFGEVREGLVHRRAQAIPCIVQHSQAPSVLLENEKRSLLKELDIIARTGVHPNVVEFLGACDERGVLLTAIEHHPTSLRGFLLRSRQPNNSKSISEPLILELCSGIAQGMSHLANRGIFHLHLSTRNIIIAEGSIPKIAHFSLGHYSPLGKKLTYSRWTAPEMLNSSSFSSKSDVWSFGVVLWEIFTLGGSPFIHINIKQLLNDLMQGVRLRKPKHITDDLYHLMLQCWLLDSEERPKFFEMSSILQNMLLNAQDHISIHELLSGPHEKFDPSAEDD